MLKKSTVFQSFNPIFLKNYGIVHTEKLIILVSFTNNFAVSKQREYTL